MEPEERISELEQKVWRLTEGLIGLRAYLHEKEGHPAPETHWDFCFEGSCGALSAADL